MHARSRRPGKHRSRSRGAPTEVAAANRSRRSGSLESLSFARARSRRSSAAAARLFPMALIVHKYGGTSMGSPERIQSVARRVAKWVRAGHQMVVVPSAMSGETNRLLALAQASSRRNRRPTTLLRELDMIASTGEQVSVGLLAIALAGRRRARGELRRLAGADRAPTAPTPRRASSAIDDARVRADLAAGKVVVITGFQGVDDEGHITTLGRGGSDTSAVAVAAALEGRRVPDLHRRRRRLHDRSAHRRRRAAPEEHQLRGDARDGEPRLQGAADPLGRVRRQVPRAAARALELHAVGHRHRRGSRARARSSPTRKTKKMEQAVVSGIAFNRDEAKISPGRRRRQARRRAT